MKLWHCTFAANEIIESGFRDGFGDYLTLHEHGGVWFSDTLLTRRRACGDAYLMIEIPEELIEIYEWIEEGKGTAVPDTGRPRQPPRTAAARLGGRRWSCVIGVTMLPGERL